MSGSTANTNRKRQFSLRQVFLVVTMVAVACAIGARILPWWNKGKTPARRQVTEQEMQAYLESKLSDLLVTMGEGGGGQYVVAQQGIMVHVQTNDWGQPVRGNQDYALRVGLLPRDSGKISPDDPEIWQTLARLQRLSAVSTAGRAGTERHILRLSGHPRLRYLNVADTAVSAADIGLLARDTPTLHWIVISDDMLSLEERAEFTAKFPNVVLHVTSKDKLASELASYPESTPAPPWLHDELWADGEFRAEDLKSFVRVQFPFCPYAPWKVASLRAMSLLPDIFICEFFGRTEVVDEHLTALAGLNTVVYLGIAGTSVTADGVQPLAGIRGLRILHVDAEQLSPEAIEGLRHQKHLKWLTVDCASLPYEHERELRQLLRGVTVRVRLRPCKGSTQEYDAPHWVYELGKNSPDDPRQLRLQAFNTLSAFYVNEVNRNMLPSLAYVPSLVNLDWNHFGPIDDAGLVSLGRLTSIKTLGLDEQMSARSFAALSGLKNLQDLSINCDGFSHEQVTSLCRALGELPGLRGLFMSHAGISDECVAALEKCRALRDLSLGVGSKVGVGEKELFSRLPQLTRFSGERQFSRPAASNPQRSNEWQKFPLRPVYPQASEVDPSTRGANP